MDTLKRTLSATLALFVVAAFALNPQSAQAQNQPEAVYVGLQGGLAQSSLTGDGVESSSRRGFTGGLEFMYNINETLSVDSDFLYAKKGGDQVVADGGASTSDAFNFEEDRVTINYVEFPVLFKLTAPIEAVKIRAMAGPSVSFLADARENGLSEQQDFQSNVQVNDRFLLYDLAGVVGGEIALPLPGLADGEVALDGRYTFGLRNVDQTQGFNIKNRSFSGSLVVRLGFR
jgi:hypothetical protein